MMTQEELAQLHQEAEAEFKKYPGVIGVGYGYKQTAGQTTDQLAFRVYVREKKARSELKPEEIIPPDFKGIPTDVIKVPDIQKVHCEDMQHHSPLIGGISISSLKPDASNNYGAGTLGFFATINGMSGPENVVLVSNNHVLMANGAQVGDTIYQPKLVEIGGVPTLVLDQEQRNPIGKIHNAGLDGNHTYQYSGEAASPYFVDCATAKLDQSISSWCGTNCGVSFKNEIRGLNIGGNSAIATVERVRQADLQPGPYVVYKVGRRTSRTVGKIVDVAVPGLNGEERMIEIEATQVDCDGIMRFVEEGDSGAALINAQNKLVGLVFAKHRTDPKRAYACHIHPVLDKLGVTAITTANPHPAASTLSDAQGIIVEGGLNHTPLLREKFLSTEQGRELFMLVREHRSEVVDLVNHRRPVTVAWHRSKGPAFLSHLINNARNPQHRVPREIEGVTRETLIQTMAKALSAHGSAGLKAIIAQYLGDALSYAEQFDSLHDLVEQLNLREVA